MSTLDESQLNPAAVASDVHELCRQAARSLPVLRVVAPFPEGLDPDRRKREERERPEVFCEGRLRTAHKSADARAKEDRLGVGDALYFHLGRCSPAYGQAVLVLADACRPDEASNVEATPFGIGALDCPGKGPQHDAGGCLSPVAHMDLAEQQDFVKESTWGGDWRSRAGDYFAHYFGEKLGRYWSTGPLGRPDLPGPHGVFADDANRGFQTWTIEVRRLADLSLAGGARPDAPNASGLVRAWAMDIPCFLRLMEDAEGSNQAIEEKYPFFAFLMGHVPQLARDTKEMVSICARVEEWVQGELP